TRCRSAVMDRVAGPLRSGSSARPDPGRSHRRRDTVPCTTAHRTGPTPSPRAPSFRRFSSYVLFLRRRTTEPAFGLAITEVVDQWVHSVRAHIRVARDI